jgi:hypothetical protein
MTNCNTAGYDQYGNTQVQFTPYQGSYSNGFCGCPAGYRPIMNPTMGLACAPFNFFHANQYGYGNASGNTYGYGSQYSYGSNTGYRPWGYAYYCFGANSLNDPRCGGGAINNGESGNITRYAGQNNQWSSITQITYSPALTGSQANCYSQAAATCDLRLANPCGNSGVCRPTGGGTYLGICSYGRGVEGYGQANGCIQRQANGGYINICGYGGYSYNPNQGNVNSQLPTR